MTVIYVACFIALILFVWFNTDAFIEYAALFKLTKLFKIQHFNEIRKHDISYTYTNFIVEFYNNFITRLLSCPVCTSVWTGFFFIPVIGVIKLPCCIILGLLLYILLVRLLA
jgi:hypothetical protein